MENLAELVEHLANALKLLLEFGSVVTIAIGMAALVVLLFKLKSLDGWLSAMRTTFSRYLLVALELQLAADIVGTAVSPSWETLAKLGAIAAIRTFLNYFLLEEIKAESASQTPADIPPQS